MSSRRAARATLAFVLAGAACHRPAPSAGDGAAAQLAQALEVEVSGCSAVLRGGVCELKPGKELRMWLPGVEDDAVHVLADGAELPVALTPWPDGRTARVTIPAGSASTVEVHARIAAGDAVGHVRVVPAPSRPPPSAEISYRARLELQGGRIPEAIADFRTSIAQHAAEGRMSEAADDAGALVWTLQERDRIAEARAALDEERTFAAEYPEGRVQVVDGEGLVAWVTGDLRTAVRRAREASEHAARLGDEYRRQAFTLTLGLRLQDLGRYAESTALFRRLLAEKEVEKCMRGDLLTNIGWGDELAFDADPDSDAGEDPIEPIDQATAVFRGACPDPNRLANDLENAALAHLQHGRLDAARAALAEAKRVEHDPPAVVAIFWHQLAGRIALAGSHAAAALREFAAAADMAAALGSSTDGLAAAEGKAAALEALGRQRDALAALDDADARIDSIAASVPLGEGMAGFLAAVDRAAVRRVSLLVQLGRTTEALQAARSWRARLLERVRTALAIEQLGPDARARWQDAVGRYRALRGEMDADTAHDWELPADRLAAARARRDASGAQARAIIDDALSALPRTPPPSDAPAPLAPGDLELLYLRAPSGWLGFARDAQSVSVARIAAIDPRSDPATLAATALGPFDAAIAAAGRVRFLPYRRARSIDFHALPWRGSPLLDHVPVEYGLGIDEPAAGTDAGSLAVVVADPGGDLPAARAEADAVSEALTKSGRWHVTDLRGAAAGGDALRNALGSAALLHYAGHASYGGPDGMDSALSLAGGQRLTPADILALPRTPPTVTLFGCDTGRESASGAFDALGLSTAFLVAGSRAVVATSRVIDDGLARQVAGEFYRRLLDAPTPDASAALRSAVLSVRDRAPSSDWAAFRVLVP
ncbi:MAG TPA: CHAT domain-containing protein [Polyangiaceae bacterium]